MAKIIFLKDITNRSTPALEFIDDLWNRSELEEVDPNYIPVDLPTQIQQAIELLEIAPIFPVGKDEVFYGAFIDDNGQEYKRKLVKPLATSPIYELLINFDLERYFRAIYFPFNLNGEQYYCFTNAFIKTPDVQGSDKTNLYRDEARRLYEVIMRNRRILENQL